MPAFLMVELSQRFDGAYAPTQVVGIFMPVGANAATKVKSTARRYTVLEVSRLKVWKRGVESLHGRRVVLIELGVPKLESGRIKGCKPLEVRVANDLLYDRSPL